MIHKRKTTEEFIKQAKEIHDDKYDYSLVNYTTAHTKVKIICKIHSIFEQSPNSHLRGKGCLLCSGSKKKTTEEFISQAIETHGNKYDYSLVEYISTKHKVKIICKEHGIFEQEAKSHINGVGCPSCSGVNKRSTNDFIKLAKEIHADKYNYSLVDYKSTDRKVKIICSIHGIFEQLPESHLKNNGCDRCRITYKSNTIDFIEKSIEKHGYIYDYSLVDYVNSNTKVKIICKKHGIFKQSPCKHLQPQVCPICKCSKGEISIRKILDNFNIIYTQEKKFEKCKNKNKLPFDFYLDNYNICIEYDGEQHFKVNNFFGNKESFQKRIINDNIKTNYCQNNNITLLRIKYNENINEKLIDFLKNQNIVPYIHQHLEKIQ